jgi:hypothetical protein
MAVIDIKDEEAEEKADKDAIRIFKASSLTIRGLNAKIEWLTRPRTFWANVGYCGGVSVTYGISFFLMSLLLNLGFYSQLVDNTFLVMITSFVASWDKREIGTEAYDA